MTSMRERVASALCNRRMPKPADRDLDAWGLLNFWSVSEMDKGEKEAVAAFYADADEAIATVLTCLESPSPEMVEAGYKIWKSDIMSDTSHAARIFQAMIREAKK